MVLVLAVGLLLLKLRLELGPDDLEQLHAQVVGQAAGLGQQLLQGQPLAIT